MQQTPARMPRDRRRTPPGRGRLVLILNRSSTAGPGGAAYNRDDIATRKEFGPGYFEYPGNVRTKSQKKRFLVRQLSRARIPDLDGDPAQTFAILSRIVGAAEILTDMLVEDGMTEPEIRKFFREKFTRLTDRYNDFYRLRLQNAKSVCRGTDLSELDAIKDGTWAEYNMKNKTRQWADVSVNMETAKKYAYGHARTKDAGVLLEIDMESVKDRLVSPGYVPDRLTQTTMMDEPDGLFRGMSNEEHHLPPDFDIAGAKIHVIIYSRRGDEGRLKKKYKKIGKNFTVESRWPKDLITGESQK